MSIKYSRIILIAATISATHGQAAARPPDTLKFNDLTFVKANERLYHEKILHVCIRSAGHREYPSALIFENKILFFDRDGRPLTERALPDISEPSVKESANGEYIYIYGSFRDRSGAINLVYRNDGELNLEKETKSKMGPEGWGIPLEKTRSFAGTADGAVIITGFDGQIRAQKKLLDPAKGEDGDILVAVSDNEKKIFAVANKYKLIPQTIEGDTPILFHLDSKLNEIGRDTLHFTTVIELRCSPDGQYVAARVGLADGRSPLIIMDRLGRELYRLENPQSFEFAGDSHCFLHLPRTGYPEVYSLVEGKKIYSPRLSRLINVWLDSDIDAGCGHFILFDGREIMLGDPERRYLRSSPFPFAFDLCRIASDGRAIIMGGEFGFVVYSAVDQ